MNKAKILVFEIQDKDGNMLESKTITFPSYLDATQLDREIALMLIRLSSVRN
jgi:hypothetical protein